MANPDKREALVTRPKSFDGLLFFAARNLAIEAMCLRIETSMLRQGFDVRAVWRESSFGNPVLELRLKNPKPTSSGWTYASATVALTRDTIPVHQRDSISECFYAVASVHATEYWPWRESKLVSGFREQVKKWDDEGYFVSEVAKVNFPFEYQHHSSF